MGETLSQVIAAYRTTQQDIQEEQPTKKLTSLLNIGGQLYAIKDPGVEQLASAIDTRLESLENATTWTEVTKGQNAAKFATAVTQGTDGSISVTYSDAETTDVKRTATAASDDVLYTAEDAEVIGGTKQVGDVKTPGKIALAGVTTEEALIELAQAIKKEIADRTSGDTTLIGTNADASTADTIYGAKAYAKDLVDALAGENWSENAKKVKEIIEEIENSDNANTWATAIDKLAGLDIKYTQAEADAYNANLTGAISTETSLTAEQATALNGLSGVSSTTYEAGQTPTAEDAALYNASLEGAKSTSSTKTPQTVKQYVDAKVAAIDATSQISSAIADLDATVGSTSVDTGKHVAVQVVETDGVLTGITVTEDDIASAQDLQDLEDAIDEQNEVTAAALTDLDARITAIDLTSKANKAAIGTGTINNWTTSYTAGTETLSWSNTETTVYVPVSGQSL